MKLIKSALLGSAAALAASASVQAADLPSMKSAPVEYVRVCDVYGSGFFYIPGTQTCLKVGGYVRVDYDYRPARRDTATADGGTEPIDSATGRGANFTRTGFYNRAAIELDARTQTAWGTVQTFMRLRQESGNGFMTRLGNGTGPSLEAAYIRFAGFTFGQAAHPFAFMSGWAYNTHYWTGWPNGIRQLAYTATFGGGFSATLALTDSHSYNGVSTAGANPAGGAAPGNAGVVASPANLTNNGVVAIGALRLDQAWGSAQVMGAVQQGGNVAGGFTAAQDVDPNSGNDRNGYAIGAGVAINLPMIAAGDRFEMTAVYHNRLINLVSDGTINTPSAGAYGLSPMGGPGFNFAAGSGWQVGAQFRHYWTPTVRSQLYASYVSHRSNQLAVAANAGNTIVGTARGNAFSLGHGLIWSPVAGFDMGLELTYLRASWNQAAANSGYGSATVTPDLTSGVNVSNFIGKVRVQRNF